MKGVDKAVERMNKARQIQFEKKMMTYRGMPSQMMAKEGHPEQVMSFGSHKNKFKSGFGTEGS